jgi:nicotinamidase-related amidase
MITAIDKHTALILIDLQTGIVNRETAHPSAMIVENAARLAQAFRDTGRPVILVNVNPLGAPASLVRAQEQSLPKDKTQIEATRQQMEAAGFFELAPGINAMGNDIRITKSTWNAFHATTLHTILRELQITGIVLAGIATSIGIESTARTANENGYNLSFVTDAMTDMFAAAHEHSLKYIFPRIGELGNTLEIISKL